MSFNHVDTSHLPLGRFVEVGQDQGRAGALARGLAAVVVPRGPDPRNFTPECCGGVDSLPSGLEKWHLEPIPLQCLPAYSGQNCTYFISFIFIEQSAYQIVFNTPP